MDRDMNKNQESLLFKKKKKKNLHCEPEDKGTGATYRGPTVHHGAQDGAFAT